MHIPPELILPQDMVDVTDLGDPPGDSEPVVMRMHVSDAKHAMDVEPERYVLVSLQPKPEAKPEIDPDAGPTVTEWVAAGYPAVKYPPFGFVSKSTPEEIEAAIAAQEKPVV